MAVSSEMSPWVLPNCLLESVKPEEQLASSWSPYTSLSYKQPSSPRHSIAPRQYFTKLRHQNHLLRYSMTEAKSRLPPPLVQCLQSAKYLHLGTCAQNEPHVSLMNYIYVPAGQGGQHSSNDDEDSVVMTCPKHTKKFANILANPRVSILVHDWTTRQQINDATDLTALLSSLNAASLSKHSITLNGDAEVITGPAAEHFKQQMLQSAAGDDAKCWIEDPDAQVIRVYFGSARISDKENNVERWNSGS